MCKGVWSMRNSIKKFFSPKRVKNLVTLATIALVSGSVITGVVTNPSANAAFVGDNDTNSIVRGGAETPAILRAKYDNLDGKGKAAFIHAGVNVSKLNQTTNGWVSRSGNVYVGTTYNPNTDKLVATNAYSYGRENTRTGSVQIPGGAYKRPTSVSYGPNTSGLKAFVLVENGSFKWAVIRACGNPVTATPTKTPPPPPAKKPDFKIVKSVKKPVLTISSLKRSQFHLAKK